MTVSRKTWMERMVADETVDIDDEIDEWHDGTEEMAGRGLPQFLGLTDEEYALFVERPSALPEIVERRNRGQGHHP